MPSPSMNRVLPAKPQRTGTGSGSGSLHSHWGRPNGTDALAVRRRYLRQRRRITGRVWTTLWVSVAAVVAWLFIVGFTGIGH